MSDERNDILGETGATAGTNAGAQVPGVVINPGQQPPGAVEVGSLDEHLEGDVEDEMPEGGAR